MPLHVSEEITAAAATHHPAVQEIAKYITKGEHLAEAELRQISVLYHDLAVALLKLDVSGPQLTIALRELISSKDAAIRSAL